MVLLRIDGVAINGLTKYDVKFADIDSSKSGRSESGTFVREVVRSKVASIDVEVGYISTSQHQSIMAAINKPFVEVEFYNGTPNLLTRTMYTSEINLHLISVEEDKWTVDFHLAEQ